MRYNIDHIRQLWNNGEGEYKNPLPYVSRRNKFREDHIFDENQSVKWNREKVAEENAKIEAEIQAYQNKTEELSEKFDKDFKAAIEWEFSLTPEQAEIVYNYIYREYHSSVFDMFGYAPEVAQFAKNLLNTVK